MSESNQSVDLNTNQEVQTESETIPVPSKRTRTDWSLDQKREIILFHENNPHYTQQRLANHFTTVFQKRIGRSTINDVLKLKTKLFSEEFMLNNDGKRLTEAKNPSLERSLQQWIIELTVQGATITDKMIKRVAREFGEQIGIKASFKYSNGNSIYDVKMYYFT